MLYTGITNFQKYRVLEIIPGFLVWSTILGAVVFSFIAPIWVIYFIIIFDAYWVLRILYMLFFVIISYRRYRTTIRVNWLERIRKLPDWETYYHIVFIPTYRESYEVLRTTFDSLIHNSFPLKRMIVVLAGEERDVRNFRQISERIQKQYGQDFYRFLITVHPSDRPDEIAGKGANMHYAGRQSKQLIDGLQIPYEKIIVSSFDADTCVHYHYFAYLTYRYATHPRPTRASYQPLAVFNNNIWDAPAITRVISYSTTFWLMTDQSRPERLFSFSSHSMSYQALVDVGFWQNDVVTEDSRISMQCIMEYDGDYEVIPLYIPVSMDVVLGKNMRQTLKAQYIQQRRWAYSVENFAFMVWNFGGNKKIRFLKKFRYIFNQLEGVYSWASAPLLIFLLGYLPIWVANSRGYTSVVAQNAPNVLQTLMTVGMIGLVVQSVLSTTLLPPMPRHYNKLKLLIMVLQWALVPVTLIVFGSIPAIDAQTRLMFGKYLGFNVTEKFRKSA